MIETIAKDEALFVAINNFKHCMEDVCEKARRVRPAIHKFRDSLGNRGVDRMSLRHQKAEQRVFLPDDGSSQLSHIRDKYPDVTTLILAGGSMGSEIADFALNALLCGFQVVVVEDLLYSRRFEKNKKMPAAAHGELLTRRVTGALLKQGRADLCPRFEAMPQSELKSIIEDRAPSSKSSGVQRLNSNADFRL